MDNRQAIYNREAIHNRIKLINRQIKEQNKIQDEATENIHAARKRIFEKDNADAANKEWGEQVQIMKDAEIVKERLVVQRDNERHLLTLPPSQQPIAPRRVPAERRRVEVYPMAEDIIRDGKGMRRSSRKRKSKKRKSRKRKSRKRKSKKRKSKKRGKK
jgi:hypothetical protein